MDATETPTQTEAPSDKRSERFFLWFSIAMVLTGAAGLYLWAYKPWHDALAGAPEVRPSLKGLMAAPLLLVLGLTFLWVSFFPRKKTDTSTKLGAMGYVYLLILLGGPIAGLIYYFWLKSFLSAHGYQ